MAIASLTSIPSRFGGLTPVLRALLAQTEPFEKIILWIPDTYRKREFNDFSLPDVPDGVDIRRCPVDYGPATKILPACEASSGIAPDQPLIYCDDDIIYPPHWASTLMAEGRRFADCAIANIGTYADIVIHRHNRPRKPAGLILKFLDQFERRRLKHQERNLIERLKTDRDTVDIAKGFGGVVVKPRFFSDAAFKIPSAYWAVDDIWLSGQLTLNNIPIKSLSSPITTIADENASIDALLDLEIQLR